MRRREVIAILGGGVVGWSLGSRAQQKAMPVIGYLSSTSPVPTALATFALGLSETGYVEGQTVVIEYRAAEGSYDRLPALAADLVSRNVDLILAVGGIVSAQAAKSAPSTIPIIFLIGTDPIEEGLIASFARPTPQMRSMPPSRPSC